MHAAVIPAEEEQSDQAFFIGDELSAVDHTQDLVKACPAHGSDFLGLQTQRLHIHLPRQHVKIVEAVIPVEGQRRAYI